MDQYYQNGPLPTWLGWYAQHLPHWFQVGTAGLTLLTELLLVWALFLPRRFRIALFFVATAMQVGIILTANYAFLNYLVLAEGFLLLDDRFLRWLLPKRYRKQVAAEPPAEASAEKEAAPEIVTLRLGASEPEPAPAEADTGAAWRRWLETGKLWASGILFAWIFYATLALLAGPMLPQWPATVLAPFRFANEYGLFAVMTRGRYEIEFQGSEDGMTWTAYPFAFKPQNPAKAPGFFAPYQPRFDWNLWFASLGPWTQSPIVVRTEERLLENDPYVLGLFAANPFAEKAPLEVRAVLWQYWFTDPATKRATGRWWRRKQIGLYAPVLERAPGGRFAVIQMPGGMIMGH
jgi:hypothetical protein